MTLEIALNNDSINKLDLTNALTVIEKLPQDRAIAKYEQKLRFVINYTRESTDPRELSEIPELDCGLYV